MSNGVFEVLLTAAAQAPVKLKVIRLFWDYVEALPKVEAVVDVEVLGVGISEGGEAGVVSGFLGAPFLLGH